MNKNDDGSLLISERQGWYRKKIWFPDDGKGALEESLEWISASPVENFSTSCLAFLFKAL